MNHEGIDAAEEPLTEEHAPAGQLNDDGPDPVEGQSKSQIDDKAEHLGQKAAHQRKLQSPSCIFDGGRLSTNGYKVLHSHVLLPSSYKKPIERSSTYSPCRVVYDSS